MSYEAHKNQQLRILVQNVFEKTTHLHPSVFHGVICLK
jgi:hypothetical protein